ncbi:MAG: enoyl-CoA hydratase-related protein [Sediminibacterium sp.]|nr:enoyl-CoA hydratase-related protein [Sediminibacterium sp.]
MTYNNLLLEKNHQTLIIKINRPDKLNALNQEVLKELNLVLNELFSNNEYLSAIITGSGGKSFIAGADIKEFLEFKDGKKLAECGQDLFKKIENSPKPIIACVNGFALGGGCELAMACHIRMASTNARFAQPEINLGLIPGWGGTQRLPMLIGKSRAIEYLLTGNHISADQALQFGLVNYVLPPEDLIPKALELLKQIHTKSQIGVEETLKAVNDYFDKDTSGFATEIYSFEKCFRSPDSKEGITAFLEKRPPIFKVK